VSCNAVDKLGAFFDIIHQDPVLSQVKLIAEPWDLGEGGYQVGNFPTKWTEGTEVPAMPCDGSGAATAPASPSWQPGFSGSSDLYEQSGRRPYASINFTTAHDGFTLADLVSYNHKHNDANGEGNSDGRTTISLGTAAWKTDRGQADPRAARSAAPEHNGYADAVDRRADDQRRRRNWAERRRQQQRVLSGQRDQLDAVGEHAGAPRLPRLHPPPDSHLEGTRGAQAPEVFFRDAASAAADVLDIAWLDPSGREMTDQTWSAPDVRCLGVRLNARVANDPRARARRPRSRRREAHTETANIGALHV